MDEPIKAMNFRTYEYSDLEKLVHDSRVAFEQKMDGTRALIVMDLSDKRVLARSGEPLRHTAATQHFPAILGELPSQVGGRVVLDGEIMFDTGKFYVFDMPFMSGGPSGTNVRLGDPFHRRRAHLAEFLMNWRPRGQFWSSDDWQQGWTSPGGRIELVESFVRPRSKLKLIRDVREAGAEGVIVKALEAPYEPGVRVTHSFKAKIVRTVDVVVMEVDRPTPRHGSITFGVYNAVGKLEQLSRCSAIGKPAVIEGDVIEVAYLAWTPGGGLREPRMTRVRTDKYPVDCTIDQLVPYSKAAV